MWDFSQDWKLQLELHYNQVKSPNLTLRVTTLTKYAIPLKNKNKQKQPQPQKLIVKKKRDKNCVINFLLIFWLVDGASGILFFFIFMPGFHGRIK